MQKTECPQCFSTKKYMKAKSGKGFEYKDCNLCDEKGMVEINIEEDFILSQNEDLLEYEEG
jgi:glutaredoxin